MQNVQQHLFLFVFICVFSFLIYLLIRDKIHNKNKKFVTIKKNKKYNQNIFRNSQDNSGVIFVSLPIKPIGIKETVYHELPKNIRLKSIKYNGVFDIIVNIDNTLEETKIKVKGDKAFVDLVNVNNTENIIEITHPQFNCNSNIDCYIEINTPYIDTFYNKGRGAIEIKGIESKEFTFHQLGLEDVSLSGVVEKLYITLKSKGDVYAQGLKSSEGFIHNNGLGDIYCNVKKNLICDIKYKGNIYLKDFNVSIKKNDNGEGDLIYRPFEDDILNFIFINFQKIFKMKIK